MPYIPQEDRDLLEHQLRELTARLATKPEGFAGRMNYALSALINGIIKERGVSYTVINDIIGVLESVKLELYRRVATPYEDSKIKENGDVYDQKTP
jgi:hypothetical protein